MPVVPVINVLTEKTVPVAADLLIIEDSADTNAKKKVQMGNMGLIRTSLALTGQTASIGATNLANSQTAGRYRIDYVLQCTTADASTPAISVLVTFSWTDGVGATSHACGALSLATVGRTSASFYVSLASGAFTYATTVDTIGSAQYALYVTSEQVA